MGAGKTTAGKILAQKKAIPFIDLDEEIEKEKGKTIAELFESLGEEKFRLIESETLIKTLQKPGAYILASGGGTPCDASNLALMKKEAILIFLNPSKNTLEKRLSDKQKSRPLLKTNDLHALLNKRLPIYSQADFQLPIRENETAEETAQKLYLLIS